ncbi:hypothetical protein QCE73_05600 [Caballeronia sp. LZ029]|uniref:hypothetical protein n=1 Tax=Caballeronia sp. LZ029 TaxID=3038564 RepID=UPI000A58ABC6|nr:hypothetical protein [Caballeronia sp. LZ029]MDR5742630.1 hypothetical protein [Caballeronia sp. LZ029]
MKSVARALAFRGEKAPGTKRARAMTYVFLRIVPDRRLKVLFRHAKKAARRAHHSAGRHQKADFQLVSNMEGTFR